MRCAEPPCSDPKEAIIAGAAIRLAAGGNTLKPSLEVSGERKANVHGRNKITECSQAQRERDGPERRLIKVERIQYLRRRLRTAGTAHKQI